MEKNIGKVVQVIGPVLDIKFENGKLPDLLNAIEGMCSEYQVEEEVAKKDVSAFIQRLKEKGLVE
mgnify:CR=1 FL=1